MLTETKSKATKIENKSTTLKNNRLTLAIVRDTLTCSYLINETIEVNVSIVVRGKSIINFRI